MTMTEKELDIIIKEHEMQTLELKESFGVECIETACAFANAHGGFIIIGVDNTGNPTKTQLRTEALRDYENRIATATEPSVAVDSEKVVFRNTQVIVLKVLENPLKPVAYKGPFVYPQRKRQPPDDTVGDSRMPPEINWRKHGRGDHARRDS